MQLKFYTSREAFREHLNKINNKTHSLMVEALRVTTWTSQIQMPSITHTWWTKITLATVFVCRQAAQWNRACNLSQTPLI